jgi:hypothetical protein
MLLKDNLEALFVQRFPSALQQVLDLEPILGAIRLQCHRDQMRMQAGLGVDNGTFLEGSSSP